MANTAFKPFTVKTLRAKVIEALSYELGLEPEDLQDKSDIGAWMDELDYDYVQQTLEDALELPPSANTTVVLQQPNLTVGGLLQHMTSKFRWEPAHKHTKKE
jgi:hypothetical protein